LQGWDAARDSRRSARQRPSLAACTGRGQKKYPARAGGATADVAAICFACAWLPDRSSDQAMLEAITRLVRALGTDRA